MMVPVHANSHSREPGAPFSHSIRLLEAGCDGQIMFCSFLWFPFQTSLFTPHPRIPVSSCSPSRLQVLLPAGPAMPTCPGS